MFNGMFQKIIISHLHFCEWLWRSVYIYFVHFRLTCAESVLYKPVEVRHCLLFFSFKIHCKGMEVLRWSITHTSKIEN